MTAAPLPAGEHRRLAVLEEYQVLDTAPEKPYDDITFLAALACEAPVALISLVDDNRQWFKSRIGMGPQETHRDYAFCAHAILEPRRLFVVTDAREDDRFAANPLVVGEPSIRFYAGAPLVTDEGDALGTLCVIDRTPRRLTGDQERALMALSGQVITQLELRRQVAALTRQASARRRYERALELHHQRLEQEIAITTEQSLTDELTGVANRRALEGQLARMCGNVDAGSHTLSVALIDVDRFKAINDAAGHLEGDEVLTHVAAVLAEEARDDDVVGRFGGDEFMVIMPDTEAEGARVATERMRRAVQVADGPAASVTISVGLATTHRSITRRGLIDLADRALYQAKAAGRNCVVAAIDIVGEGASLAPAAGEARQSTAPLTSL